MEKESIASRPICPEEECRKDCSLLDIQVVKRDCNFYKYYI